MKDIPEFAIQNQILNYLRVNGIFHWRQENNARFDKKKGRHLFYGMKGVPDILGILKDGRLLAIEVKSEKGVVSIHQDHFIKMINERNGIAFVARSWEDVRERLKIEGVI